MLYLCCITDVQGVELFYSQNNASMSYLYLVFTNGLARDIFVEKLLEQPMLRLDESDQEKMTLRWQNRVLSNYDYLLYLNRYVDHTYIISKLQVFRH